MADQILDLLDPNRKIGSSSEAVRRAATREHESLESLLDLLCSGGGPVVAAVDGTSLPEDSLESFRGREPSRLCLVLVAVSDADEGCRWLGAGATDFALNSQPDFDARCEGLLRLHRDLLSPRYQAGVGPKYLRKLVHDIKNPLGCIFGYVELVLQEAGVSPEVREDLEQVLNNAEVLKGICDQVGERIEELDTVRSGEGLP